MNSENLFNHAEKRVCIGITGKAGAGKDTFARILADEFHARNFGSVEINSFAFPLKSSCAAAFDIPKNCFELPGTKEEPDYFWGLSPRQIAQFFGTEIFREIDEDFWVRLMLKHILEGEFPSLIIPDVRFQNEAEFICEVLPLFGYSTHLIHLQRYDVEGKSVGIANHASEQGINFSTLRQKGGIRRIHLIENDGSLDDLKNYATNFINSYINP